jgi:hypothetical protein
MNDDNPIIASTPVWDVTPRFINDDGYEVDENGELVYDIDNDIAYFQDMLEDTQRRAYEAEGLLEINDEPSITWDEPF